MLMFRERRPAIHSLRGWAVSVLNEVGAIRECGQHGWIQDRGDPHAHDRAFDVARQNPPEGYSPEAAAVAIAGGRRGRDRRSPGIDRRYMPRVPAGGDRLRLRQASLKSGHDSLARSSPRDGTLSELRCRRDRPWLRIVRAARSHACPGAPDIAQCGQRATRPL